MLSIDLTVMVTPLRTALHGWQAVWRRCSSLQGTTMLPRRALPVSLPTAHSGTSNCRFQDNSRFPNPTLARHE
jgi:hypothetical protein